MGKKLKVKLECPVESTETGGVFFFKPPDRALNRLIPIMQSLVTSRKRALKEQLGRTPTPEELAAAENVDSEDADLPEGLMDAVVDLFTEGVVSWRDVEDAAGAALPCTRETKAMIPTDVKWQVGFAYLEKWGETEEKKAASVPPATNSTPAETTEDS